ncbi:hypothetical protein PHAVU_005G164600 [Phaseolus vulgaris]|uniref:Uncharacterized protein n=1 Tax=Phaseolus vulgaris TaxID=3885 RepID=V7C103_PHAVU|nr:hypothetical protein PHAVU_005G164600g [Phaseolus vulgaris]ESW22576.1 hypothetical protein PHAVU_005G164600g [Phaseolus vulgaris]
MLMPKKKPAPERDRRTREYAAREELRWERIIRRNEASAKGESIFLKDFQSKELSVFDSDYACEIQRFSKLRDRGQGFGILVSKFPKYTTASYSLQEPNKVMDFLQRLVEWKQWIHVKVFHARPLSAVQTNFAPASF